MSGEWVTMSDKRAHVSHYRRLDQVVPGIGPAYPDPTQPAYPTDLEIKQLRTLADHKQPITLVGIRAGVGELDAPGIERTGNTRMGRTGAINRQSPFHLMNFKKAKL